MNLLARYQYELDRVGNRAAATETLTTTTTIRYTYDPLQRLTGAAYSDAYTYTFAYAYDKVGNRTISTQTATASATPTASTLVTTYTYNAANRLTSVNGQAYTWDANPAPLRSGGSLRSRQSEAPLVRCPFRTGERGWTHQATLTHEGGWCIIRCDEGIVLSPLDCHRRRTGGADPDPVALGRPGLGRVP